MKNLYSKTIMSILALLVFSTIAFAQTSAFTYQGKLTDGSVAANGQYDFTFRLFDVVAGGTQVGIDVLSDDVQVTAGIFTVNLNFGAAPFTSGADRYLEIAVRAGASTGAYTALAPRQPLTSSPFSIRTFSASSADDLSAVCAPCVRDSQIIDVDGLKVTGTVANAANASTATNVSGVVQIANGGTGSPTQNFVDITTNQRRIGGDKEFLGVVSAAGSSGVFSGNGSQLTNLNGANLTDGSITAAKLAAGAVFRWNVVSTPEFQAEANNGYVINRPNLEVSVNLPTSPQVGDFIRVESATDQGFRITQNSGQSITIGNGNIQNIAWTPRASIRNWKSVASSADGTKLVAVVAVVVGTPGGGNIYTSTDSGVTWIDRTSGLIAAQNWSSVASSADGAKLVAAVNFGQIYTSTDSGVTWTPHESNRNWTSVVSSADGTRLNAIATQIYTSGDSGESWTPRGFRCSTVASDTIALQLVGMCNPGSPLNPGIYTSPNGGQDWIYRGLVGANILASSADGTKLVGVGNPGGIYTSTDSGVTWTLRDNVIRDWTSVASSADGTKLVAVVRSGNIYTSTDSGITWIPQETARTWVSVASSTDGTKLVAAAELDFIYVRGASVSTSGSLGGIIAGNSTSVELIYLGAGKFLILNQKGSIVVY